MAYCCHSTQFRCSHFSIQYSWTLISLKFVSWIPWFVGVSLKSQQQFFLCMGTLTSIPQHFSILKFFYGVQDKEVVLYLFVYIYFCCCIFSSGEVSNKDMASKYKFSNWSYLFRYLKRPMVSVAKAQYKTHFRKMYKQKIQSISCQ
jgi:hypothetical protein